MVTADSYMMCILLLLKSPVGITQNVSHNDVTFACYYCNGTNKNASLNNDDLIRRTHIFHVLLVKLFNSASTLLTNEMYHSHPDLHLSFSSFPL